ncbi:sensor histidine kinase [Ruminiclostridium cellobioparum]|uniref:Signal transduction histidine kinase LytS n=1 Tax=Ruminiclostridium cellobioparum subsp. termitidis CT1112 TaxID=1195236 RepID=S0FP27_RUMCE|nr:histidine kinase [Ruminiclostridium cellobioparum]EMS73985.1 signal transduction histidine kinase LytS [Ruminiclostridium cellobioparum subsp. termitidis CT1112]
MKLITKFKNSVFAKLVGAFLIAILPVCFIAIGLYNWQIKILDESTVDAFDNSSRKCLASIEKELKKVQDMGLSSMHDEDLIMLATASSTMSNYQKTLSINRYMNRLEILKNSSAYINEVSTYIPELSRVIDSDRDIYSDASSLLTLYDISRQQNIGHFVVSNNQLYYVFVPAGTPNGSLPKYFITVSLSKEEIRKELSSIKEARQVMIYDEAGSYVYYNQEGTGTQNADLAQTVGTGSEPGVEKVMVEGENSWLINHKSELMGVNLAAYVPVQGINPQMKDLRLYFVIFSAILIITVMVLSYSMYKIIKTPLNRLVKVFKQIETGSLGVRLKHRSNDEFGLLYHSFNSMAEKNQDLMEQVYQQKILTQSAQLKQLQSQINPHFLYNSFFVISNMARLGDFDSIKLFSEYLARYYRFIMQKKDGDIPFSQEVEHTRVYADIQKIRFGDRIQIEMEEVPERALHLRVPRLILQPLVENAFEHGLRHVESDGLLRITFAEEANILTVVVENNGPMDDETLENVKAKLIDDGGEISGMINIHKRLKSRFGQDSGISVSRGEAGGMKITMKICGVENV